MPLFTLPLNPSLTLLFVLMVMFVLFIVGRIRFDIVALGGLVLLVLLGVIPGESVFDGFADPVIVTVVAVFVVSAGLVRAGLTSLVSRNVLKFSSKPLIALTLLIVITTVLSGFINNVAAISIMIPIAISAARGSKWPASFFLMPVAFASLLGGVTTSIGTTATIIATAAREEATGVPFDFFAFTPIGYAIAIVCVLFIVTIGWKLIPRRHGKANENNLFDVKDYVTEVQLNTESSFSGKPLLELLGEESAKLEVAQIIRQEETRDGKTEEKVIHHPSLLETLYAGDILLIEADSITLQAFLTKTNLTLLGGKALSEEDLGADSITTMETVVGADSSIIGKTLGNLDPRFHYGTNILALSRNGGNVFTRLAETPFHFGDILLLRGKSETLYNTIDNFNLLPLHERGLLIGAPRHLIVSFSILLLAVLATVFDFLPVYLAFLFAALVMILTRLVPINKVYSSIDWPVVVLLGSMITIGSAFEATGTADLVASFFLNNASFFSPDVAVLVTLIAAMLLGNVIDNAAIALIMSPIVILIAQGLGVSIDPFLVAVAVGASTSFMTPIGEEPNALVFGPGGYQFTDYLPLGFFLSVIVVIVGYLAILAIWPL